MSKLSAGLVLVDSSNAAPTFLLVHPGGPFWAKKDDGAWSIPKGEHDSNEDPLTVAKREFAEEVGRAAPMGECHPLGEIKQSSGKVVSAWVCIGRVQSGPVTSNLFEMEWPRGSGKMQSFPEVDRVAMFDYNTAMVKILKGQQAFLERACGTLITAGSLSTDFLRSTSDGQSSLF